VISHVGLIDSSSLLIISILDPRKKSAFALDFLKNESHSNALRA